MSQNKMVAIMVGIGIMVVVIIHVILSIAIIPSGNVGVISLFGKVDSSSLEEGFHFINPYAKVTLFNAQEKTIKESLGVPSQDKLITNFDISIRYKLIRTKAPQMLRETGSPGKVIEVHLIPKIRSKIREIGKEIEQADEFFLHSTQKKIQDQLLLELESLKDKGIKVEELLIRDVSLPDVLTKAVIAKKKEEEEFIKYQVEQKRKKAKAEAEKMAAIVSAQKEAEVLTTLAEGKRKAAEIDAQALLIKAEAEKKAKQLLIDVVGRDNFVRLEALKVLPSFQNGNHVIIMDPKDVNPLPFMNLTPKK